jgi:UDP:flavonoid glycosyltransferase YjiC (YdhE family)
MKMGMEPVRYNFDEMTSESISSAIKACITNNIYKNNAMAISGRLKNNNGIELTIQLLEKEFINKARC